MRSLFLRIFLSILVTVLLVVVAMVITWNLQPELALARWRNATGDATALYAQTCAEEYDRYGQKALENYLQRIAAGTHVHATVYDETGKALSGRDNPEAREVMQQVMASGQPEFAFNGPVAVAAQRAIGPSGHVYVFVAQSPRPPLGAFRLSGRLQLLRLVLALLIISLICFLLTRSLTAPILRLRGTATQLATGDLTARVDSAVSKRPDEIGDLARDFNRMAGRIEDLITSERQLIRDISHELRSPLARLNVALGLARRRSTEETGPALDRIEQEAETLNEMIGRLLALAKMDAASEPPEPVRIDMNALLKEVASDAAFEAQEKGVNVQIVAATDCCVNGSPELLRSAIENVVRNAIRYSPSGQPVELRLICESNGSGKLAEISVRDHGPGVPENELENLFRPFYRVADARERDTGGIGLGLAITYRAAKLHKGSVTAKNAPGGGLLVTVMLPVC